MKRFRRSIFPEVTSPKRPGRSVGARASGCLACDYFRGQWSGEHVVRERFEKDRVIGDARIGCAYWMRAVGSDD